MTYLFLCFLKAISFFFIGLKSNLFLSLLHVKPLALFVNGVSFPLSVFFFSGAWLYITSRKSLVIYHTIHLNFLNQTKCWSYSDYLQTDIHINVLVASDESILPIPVGGSLFESFNLSPARILNSCRNCWYFRYTH